MMRKFKSKHQKLILQCYPPGRGSDKRPNASELSYLLYYVSTRRVKLGKVGAFLERKARSDVNRGRSGNVEVTLDICNALIERCHEDLNMFASNVVAILSYVLGSNDLALCQHSSPVFNTFCKYHDGALFTGDPEYVRDFHRLVGQYVTLATSAKGTDGPNSLQWKFVGIDAAKSIASSIAISTPTGEAHISSLVPLLLANLSLDDSDGSALLANDAYFSSEVQRRDGKRSSVIAAPIKEENLTEQQLFKLKSAQALRQFFDATNGGQIGKASEQIVSYILNNNRSLDWSATIIELVSKWTPVQMRFIILTMLVNILVTVKVNVSQQIVLANLVSMLLSSSVNMVGLSVIDVMRTLLTHQSQLFKGDINGYIEEKQLEELGIALRRAIAALAAHIYYADQISDMVAEILFRCRDSPSTNVSRPATSIDGILQQTSAANTANTPSPVADGTKAPKSLHLDTKIFGSTYPQPAPPRSAFASISAPSSMAHTILLVNFSTIQEILKTSMLNQGGLQRNPVALSAWDGTQSLLRHPRMEIRNAYANTFLTYLETEVSELDTHVKIVKNFIVTRGTLGRFVYEIYNVANDSSSDKEDYIRVHRLISRLTDKYGANGYVRLLPLCLMIQNLSISIIHGESEGYRLDQAVALANLSLCGLFNISQHLSDKGLATELFDEIGRRKKLDLWYNGIDIPIRDYIEGVVRQSHDAKIITDPPSIHAPQWTAPRHYDVSSFSSVRFFTKSDLETRIDIPELPKSLSHILFDDLPQYEDTRPHAESNSDEIAVNGGDLTNGNKAKSLHQLNLSGYPYFVENNPLISTDVPKRTGGSVHMGRTFHSIATARRDFSPKISDLRRAASGYNVQVKFSPAYKESSYAPSVRSFASNQSAAMYEDSEVDGFDFEQEKLDVSTFLNNLNITSADRGSLAN